MESIEGLISRFILNLIENNTEKQYFENRIQEDDGNLENLVKEAISKFN